MEENLGLRLTYKLGVIKSALCDRLVTVGFLPRMRLFKYLHPDRIDVIERAYIRFSPPHAFNDPFDMKPHIRGLATRELWNSQISEALPKIIEERYTEQSEQFRQLVPLTTLQALFGGKLPDLQAVSFGIAEVLSPHIGSLIESKFEELIGIACFTDKPDSLLMWAHYADSHQGFVIEVDPAHQFFNRRRFRNG